eukprot:jgi/Psemu1/46925/gm1.46925_g
MSLAGKHIELDILSHDEHVPEAKQYNRTIKERCQSIFSTLPYTKVPKRMIIEMVRNVTFYLNVFPWDNGVSMDLAPTTIVTGIAPDYSLHFQVAYGIYSQTQDETYNTMKAQTTRAIAMGPTQNFQGGVDFYSLLSRRIILRTPNDYTICPMPDKAIRCIERLAQSSRPGLHLTNLNNEPYTSDDDDNSTYSPPSDKEYNSDSSRNDDDDCPMDHPIAPAGVTNADTNTNTNLDTNNDDDNITDEVIQHDTDITGVANVKPIAEGITGVAKVPDQPADTDDETTDKEDNEASTVADQHEEDTIWSSSYGCRLNQGQYRRPMSNQFECQYFQGTLDGGTIKTSKQIEPLSTDDKTNYDAALQYIETSTHREQMIEDYILTCTAYRLD